MIFDRLHPRPGPVTAPELLAGLRDRPRVVLNMVATVDGRATVDGGSKGIGGPGDRRMFAELRAVADAVLIGTGTLRVEPYGRLVRSPERRARRAAAGLAEDPTAVLWSRALDLPWDAPLFSEASQPVVVICDADGSVPSGLAAPVTLLPAATLAEGLAVLRGEHGVGLLLCEGGPTLNARLLAEGLLDDLFLTLGPRLAGEGSAPGIVNGPARPAELELRWVVRHADELLLRYAVQQQPGEDGREQGDEEEGEVGR